MKRIKGFTIMFVLLAVLAAACTPAADEPAAVVITEPITIEFWHAMRGGNGERTEELVAKFNASQDLITVNSTAQGTYDDAYNALLAAFETGGEPNITQNFDLAAQTMIDTGRLIPASVLMKADGYDPNTFIPAVRDYYSDDQGMVAMAFNSSTPIVYYNADMFAAAGLDEPAPDWTFSDFLAACDSLQQSGVEFCVTFGTVGWFYEQILANSGGLYFNENNGRTGRATEAVFNQGQGVEVFEFLSGLIKDDRAPNLGSTWSDTDSVFFAGQAAMEFDSTAGARGIQDGSDFPVKTAFMPHSDSSERNGVIIGGAALWLLDSGDDAENAAAWEFMKFVAEEDQQVEWHIGTGYFSVRADAQDNAELAAFWEENPNFLRALDQLLTTKTTLADGSPNYAVLGGRAGPFPAIRTILKDAYARVLDDGWTAQEALDEAVEKSNQELADYNTFFED